MFWYICIKVVSITDKGFTDATSAYTREIDG